MRRAKMRASRAHAAATLLRWFMPRVRHRPCRRLPTAPYSLFSLQQRRFFRRAVTHMPACVCHAFHSSRHARFRRRTARLHAARLMPIAYAVFRHLPRVPRYHDAKMPHHHDERVMREFFFFRRYATLSSFFVSIVHAATTTSSPSPPFRPPDIFRHAHHTRIVARPPMMIARFFFAAATILMSLPDVSFARYSRPALPTRRRSVGSPR